MSKKFILPILSLLVAGGVMFATTKAYAFGFRAGNGDDVLIQKLAEAFGKSETEVEAVFEDLRLERQQQLQAQYQERLDQAVENGELTEEEKQLILNKHAELRLMHEEDWANRENMTPEEWRAQREAERDELESWAEEHNIDLKYFHLGLGRGMGMGKGHGLMMHRGDFSSLPTP